MSPLTAALLGLPIVCAWLVILYVRSSAKKVEGQLRAALNRACAPLDVATLPHLHAFSAVPAGNTATPQDIDATVRTLTSGSPLAHHGTTASMRHRVELLLGGLHSLIGAPAPLTSSAERDAMAWPVRGCRGAAPLMAAQLGLTLRAAALPEACPSMLAGRVVCYRDDDDAHTWMLFGIATAVLSTHEVEANEADAWLLAARLARPAALFERAPVSRASSHG